MTLIKTITTTAKIRREEFYLQNQENALKEKLLLLDKQLADVEGDYTRTTAEKYAAKLAILQQIRQELVDIAKANALAMTSPGLSDEDRLALDKKNTDLGSQVVGVDKQIGGLGPNPYSFGDQFSAVTTDIANQWGTLAIQMANVFKETFQSAVSSVSEGIQGLIMGTKSWDRRFTQSRLGSSPELSGASRTWQHNGSSVI